MADRTVSAIPAELIGWAAWAQGADSTAQSMGRRLSAALANLYASSDPGLLPPALQVNAGNDLVGYSVRNSATDQWVGRVGQAFADAGTTGIMGRMLTPEDRQAIIAGTVVSSQEAIALLAGRDPTVQGQDQAQAAVLAAEVLDAQHVGGTRLELALLGRLNAHEHDPTYTAAFFRELGAENTLGLVRDLHGAGGDLLRVYDTALATATNSPGWDLAFNSQIWPSVAMGDVPVVTAAQKALLAYGSYSQDFLTRAGDYIFFGPLLSGRPFVDAGAVQQVLDAFARNGSAATAYLLSSLPAMDRSRLVMLLAGEAATFQQSQAAAGALGRMLAGASASAGTSAAEAMLRILGEEPNNLIPDGARSGIATMVDQHIGLFVPHIDPNHPQLPHVWAHWTWQENVIKAAIADNQGNVSLANVSMIQHGVWRWAQEHMPALDQRELSTEQDEFRRYLYQLGTLWALPALAVRQSTYDAQRFRQTQAQDLQNLLGFIPLKVPFVDKLSGPVAQAVASYIGSHAMSWAEGWATLQASQSGGNPDAFSVKEGYAQLWGLRTLLAARFVGVHPGLVAGMNHEQTAAYIKGLAQQEDPTTSDRALAGVQRQFETFLDSANAAFWPVYQNPGRS